MCSLILFSLYTNDLFKYKNHAGTAAKVKVKLFTKIKKHKQLYFGTLVPASYYQCGDNAKNMDFFQNTRFKENDSISE